MKLSSLSILIPAYKDEKTIETVIKQADRAGKMFALRHEILVINDASPDATAAVLNRLAKTTPGLRVIHHTANQGYGGTVKHLYLSGTCDWLFCVPGDYQMDPMELGKLVPHSDKADMIIGRRVIRQDTWNRKMQSLIYNGLLRFLFGVQIYDVNSVRLMKRKVVQKKLLRGTSAFIDAKLTIQTLRSGFRVIEVPIHHRIRETGDASGGKLSVIVPVIREMIQYRFEILV